MKFFKKNEDFSSKPIEEKEWFNNYSGQLIIDVYRERDELIVRAPIAGAKTEDINVIIEKDILKISGKRDYPEGESERSYFIKECYWGEFLREIVLPVEVDGQRTKAKISSGILTISMPIIEREDTNKINIE